MSIDDAQLARIEQALRRDHVYVDPQLQSAIRPEVLAQVRSLAASSPTTVEVVVTPLAYDDPNFHGRPELLAGTLHSDLGGDAAYVLVTRSFSGSPPEVDATGYGVESTETASLVASEQHPDDPSAQLLTTVRLIHDGTAEDAYQRLQSASSSPSATSSSSTSTPSAPAPGGGGDQHPGVVVFFVLLTVVVVVLSLRARYRHVLRRRGFVASTARGAVTSRPFTLPAGVLGHIRAAQEAETAKQADRDVLALGERIDGTELTAQADTSAWQAALDHYDLARRILDGPHGPADVVGAVVLAARGQSALSAAVAGRSWRPTPPCFLNPLHGPGRPTEWDGAAGRSSVPMCEDCARAVRRGARPDVLDFVVDGEARHYYDLDLQPWSSTGYGALDPDLTGALFDRVPRSRRRPTARRRGADR